MITIYDINGNVRLRTDICKGSTYRFQLMQEDRIRLVFSLGRYIVFSAGDYVDFGETVNGTPVYASEYPVLAAWGRRFELTGEYKPRYNTKTGGYDYELTLDADYWKWKNKILRYAPGAGGAEASFSLTGTPDVFLDLLTGNLDILGYHYRGQSYGYIISEEFASKNIAVTFSAKSITGALSDICQAIDPDNGSCEWWVDGGTIHIGRCEHPSSAEVLSIGTELESVSGRTGSASFANRLYAFGSARNITGRYRKEIVLTFDTDGQTATGISDTYRDSARDIDYSVFYDRCEVAGQEIQFPASGSNIDVHLDESSPSYETTVVFGDRVNGTAVVHGGTARLAISQVTCTFVGRSGESLFYADFYLSDSQGREYMHLVRVVHDYDGRQHRWYDSDGNQTGNYLETELPADLMGSLAGEEVYLKVRCTKDSGSIHETLSFAASIEFTNPSMQTTLSLLGDGNEVEAYVTATLNWQHAFRTEERSKYFLIEKIAWPDGTETTSDFSLLSDRRLGLFCYRDGGGNLTFDGGTLSRDYAKGKANSGLFTSLSGSSEYLNGIVSSNLRLPQQPVYEDAQGNLTFDGGTGGVVNTMVYDGSGRIESVRGLEEEQYVESLVVFEDIYPTFAGVAGNVTAPEDAKKTETVDGAVFTHYNYRFKNTELKNFSTEYFIGGEDIFITFGDVEKNGRSYSGGRLAGLTFKILFKPGLSDGTGAVFEIERNENYGVELPNGDLYPSDGDGYTIYGFDTSIYDDGEVLTTEAELELVRTSLLYLKYKAIDTNQYDCSLMAGYAKDRLEQGRFFRPGERVRVKEGQSLLSDSRIMGGEFKLDIPWDNPVLYVGECTAYSRFGELAGTIKGISFSKVSVAGAGSSGKGGGTVTIIKTTDTIEETDSNVYSALRTKTSINSVRTALEEAIAALEEKFLRKDRDDSTPYKLTMGEADVTGDLKVDGEAAVHESLTVGTAASQESGGEVLAVRGTGRMRPRGVRG